MPIAWLAALGSMMLGFTACRTTAPAVRFSEQPWSYGGCDGRRLVTDHFDLYTTLDDPRFVAALPEFLEAAHQQYAALAPRRSPAEERLTTYLFGTRLEWDRFVQANYPARHDVYAKIRSGGFTEGGSAVIFHKSPPTTLATLAHEGWHQYAEALPGPAVPAWLNEGAGCTFEGFEFIGGRPRFTPLRNTFRVNFLREGLTTGALLPLRQLLEVDAGEMLALDDSRLTQTYYAQTWALIAFLRHGEGGRYAEAFRRMMADLSDGVLHVHLSAARLRAVGRAAGAAPLSDGRALFEAYFGPCDDELAGAYDAYLLKLASLERRGQQRMTNSE